MHSNTEKNGRNRFEIAPEILGNIESIDQCIELLEHLSNEDYVADNQPYLQSSIGEHVRHLLDVFQAFMHGSNTGFIDYNFKRRGDLIETCRLAALKELREIRAWLCRFADDCFLQVITVRSEVTLHQQSICDMVSTWQRELVFIASHAIHHCAIIGVAIQLRQGKVGALVGVAPATATFRREKSSK